MNKYIVLLDFMMENNQYTQNTSTILRDFMKQNFNDINDIEKLKFEYDKFINYFNNTYKNGVFLDKEKIKRRILVLLMIALGGEKYLNENNSKIIVNPILQKIFSIIEK